ncbi:hypothetical protein A1O3_09175 [Capronia epimyces CBS 606.96]|uniref:Alpha/beta hydrolase fold-3 domain-containing protein n=1 Tax=Capronia epimyces CBS 606.96 TaxID=1182542 RepID=W9XM07_9EURO|nr:uncharacterized protein A1O3_09175 [Capronia epimyces CBS 606.96]EXJ78016.1 hypothetical protein A1O3_09175 [Capronia epimyces CBS 606.96]
MADSITLHPFGLQYYLLLVAAWSLRLPAMILDWTKKRKSLDVLETRGVTRKRIQVPSRENGRTIAVDIYEKANQPKDAKRYTHLNFHGSGFIIPSLGSDVDFCSDLASTGVVVFDADYRKAPEHPFPAAYYDAQDVLSYIQNHSSDFDVSRLTIGGFSAGANLAMALAVTSPPGSIVGLASFYGNTDLTSVYPAPNEKSYDAGTVLPAWLRRFFYRCYVLPNQDRADPRLSPANAPLDRWPKHVFLACGTADSLHEAGRIMIDRLRESGHRDAEFLSVEREAHAFDKSAKEGSPTEKKTQEVYRKALAMIERSHE